MKLLAPKGNDTIKRRKAMEEEEEEESDGRGTVITNKRSG